MLSEVCSCETSVIRHEGNKGPIEKRALFKPRHTGLVLVILSTIRSCWNKLISNDCSSNFADMPRIVTSILQMTFRTIRVPTSYSISSRPKGDMLMDATGGASGTGEQCMSVRGTRNKVSPISYKPGLPAEISQRSTDSMIGLLPKPPQTPELLLIEHK